MRLLFAWCGPWLDNCSTPTTDRSWPMLHIPNCGCVSFRQGQTGLLEDLSKWSSSFNRQRGLKINAILDSANMWQCEQWQMHTEKDKRVCQTNVQSPPQPAVFCSQNQRKSCDYSPFGVKAERLTGPRPPAVGRAICFGLFCFFSPFTNK